jgi:hypothetical protein
MNQVILCVALVGVFLAVGCFGSFVIRTPPVERSGRLLLFLSEFFFSLGTAVGLTYGLKAFAGWKAFIAIGSFILGGLTFWPLRRHFNEGAASDKQSSNKVGNPA